MLRWRLLTFIAFLGAGSTSAQVLAPKVETPQIPPGVDAFNLSFEDFRKYSTMKGFELVGQNYFKVPERAPWAKAQGRPGPETGSGFNTVRVPRDGRLIVDHGEIKGFMAAMQMSYAVASPSLLNGLNPGDKIQFTIDAGKSTITAIHLVESMK